MTLSAIRSCSAKISVRVVFLAADSNRTGSWPDSNGHHRLHYMHYFCLVRRAKSRVVDG